MALTGMGEPGAGAGAEEVPAGSVGFWKLFGVLLALSLIGSVVIIPFSWSLVRQMALPASPVPEEVLLTLGFVVQTGVELLLSAIAIALGLRLGDRIGLGAPLLRALLAGDPGARPRLRATALHAFVIGLAAGAVVVGLALAFHSLLPAPPKPIVHPPAWEGFLAAIGAGIREEIWLRLGLMTLLVWLGTRLGRGDAPGLGVLWTANVGATLLFGAIHLPQAAGLYGNAAWSPPAVAYVLLLNGIAGLVFGWLYWRRGLLAAMIAHFSADIVLHVIAPSISR